MNRKIYYWKLAASEMQLGDRTLVMGVINLTPDSFSDGGRFNDPDVAYARALELEEAGADIIDLGAESTRPGSSRISADEEWQRLLPVLKKLKGNLRVPISLDTYKAEIAERALNYGVEIINDPSGLTYDPGLAKVVALGNAGLILNHMRGTPETWAKMPPMQDPIGGIARELEATISRARRAGVERSRIVIDPGLGFGKRKEQNAEIVGRLGELAGLEYPILVGASRKSFLAQANDTDTMFATAAAVTVAALNGAHIVRVHDVAEMRVVVGIADEIMRAVTAGTKVPEPEEKPVARASREMAREDERPRPPRPPLMRPVVVLAPSPEVTVAAASEEAEVEAEMPTALAATEPSAADAEPGEAVVTEASDAGLLTPTVEIPEVASKPAFETREDKREDKPWEPRRDDGPKTLRTPGKFSEDREKFREGGFRPPSRPAFRTDRPQFDRPRFDRPAPNNRGGDDYRPRADGPPPPRRDRDFRPGAPRNFGPGNDGSRNAGSRNAGSRNDAPNRPFDRESPPRDRPRWDGPRRDGPPSREGRGGDRPPFGRGGERPSFGRGGDRPQGDRPPFGRSGDRPQGDRPAFQRRPPGGAPPREGFRPGGRPDSAPPRGPGGFRPGGFKPSGFRPGGPPRSNDRDDRRPPFGGERGGDRPGGGGFRPGGDRPGGGGRPSGPPNRPFRKRP